MPYLLLRVLEPDLIPILEGESKTMDQFTVHIYVFDSISDWEFGYGGGDKKPSVSDQPRTVSHKHRGFEENPGNKHGGSASSPT